MFLFGGITVETNKFHLATYNKQFILPPFFLFFLDVRRKRAPDKGSFQRRSISKSISIKLKPCLSVFLTWQVLVEIQNTKGKAMECIQYVQLEGN